MTGHQPAVDGLRRHARQRSDDARNRIELAIRHLRREKSAININSVARRAGVSRKTIYSHDDLLERIKGHRHTPAPPQPAPEPSGQPHSIVAALRNTLAAKDKHITELQQQLRQRDQAIAALHGEIERLTT